MPDNAIQQTEGGIRICLVKTDGRRTCIQCHSPIQYGYHGNFVKTLLYNASWDGKHMLIKLNMRARCSQCYESLFKRKFFAISYRRQTRESKKSTAEYWNERRGKMELATFNTDHPKLMKLFIKSAKWEYLGHSAKLLWIDSINMHDEGYDNEAVDYPTYIYGHCKVCLAFVDCQGDPYGKNFAESVFCHHELTLAGNANIPIILISSDGRLHLVKERGRMELLAAFSKRK